MKHYRPKLSPADFKKLSAIDNPNVHEFIAKESDLCHPEKIFICSDSAEDIAYVRKQAIATGEEKAILTMTGHTVTLTANKTKDETAKPPNTSCPKALTLSKALNQIDRQEGLAEVMGLLSGLDGWQNHDCPLHRSWTRQTPFSRFWVYNALIHGMLPILNLALPLWL